MKKEGVKRSYRHLKTKSLRKFRKKMTKKGLVWIGQRRTGKELLKRIWKVWEHVKESSFFKKLTDRFLIDRKTDSIGQKSYWIDPTSIENWSSQADSNLILSHFRLVEQQVRSFENLEKTNFWKTEHFNAETPQSTLFYK